MMKIQMGLVAGLLSLLGIAFFLGFTKPEMSYSLEWVLIWVVRYGV